MFIQKIVKGEELDQPSIDIVNIGLEEYIRIIVQKAYNETQSIYSLNLGQINTQQENSQIDIVEQVK